MAKPAQLDQQRFDIIDYAQMSVTCPIYETTKKDIVCLELGQNLGETHDFFDFLLSFRVSCKSRHVW